MNQILSIKAFLAMILPDMEKTVACSPVLMIRPEGLHSYDHSENGHKRCIEDIDGQIHVEQKVTRSL